MDVRRGDQSLGTLSSGKNDYRAEEQVSNEVGIRSDHLTGEDLFVITDQINRDQSIVFKVLVKPLVNLIWLAGFVFFAGALVALWPSAAEQRRLAPATATARARTGMTALAIAVGGAAGRRLRALRGPSFLREPDPAATCSTSPERSSGARSSWPSSVTARSAALKELEFDHRTGQDLRRGLPRADRPAAAASRRSAARPRAPRRIE